MEPSSELRFDGWTLCRATGELHKDGRCVRLQIQPQRILEELLSHPGELVTRERLISLLWPRAVVDFDASLNTAVHKLREALGDRAERPRYIETVPRRGYRFASRHAEAETGFRVGVDALRQMASRLRGFWVGS